jgi:hypothetical protein
MGGRSSPAGMSGRMAPNATMGNGPDRVEIFSKTDTDGSGGLDQTEFQTLTDIISEATGEDVDVEELFATYDEDGDGVLSEEEATAAMEANRPQGPPPGGLRSETLGSRSMMSAGIERYMQAAALGMRQREDSNGLAAMFGGNGNANTYSGGWFNSVNTFT